MHRLLSGPGADLRSCAGCAGSGGHGSVQPAAAPDACPGSARGDGADRGAGGAGTGAVPVRDGFHLVPAEPAPFEVHGPAGRGGGGAGCLHGELKTAPGGGAYAGDGYADALYPHFLGAGRTDPLRFPEAGAGGGGFHQALPAGHGDEHRCDPGPDPDPGAAV